MMATLFGDRSIAAVVAFHVASSTHIVANVSMRTLYYDFLILAPSSFTRKKNLATRCYQNTSKRPSLLLLRESVSIFRGSRSSFYFVSHSLSESLLTNSESLGIHSGNSRAGNGIVSLRNDTFLCLLGVEHTLTSKFPPPLHSYFHKLFLRDDPQLCLRMSSHSSNKFQEPTTLMPNPAGIPFMPYGMMPNMLPPGMTQVDVAQQNQLINQQLQQLQWQQYQLQQYQQQQQSQQHNHANGPPLAAAAPAGPPGQASQQQQQQQQQTPQYTGPIPAWGSFPAQYMMMQGMASVQMPQGSQPQQQQQQQSNPQQHTTEAPNTGNTEGSGTSQAAS